MKKIYISPAISLEDLEEECPLAGSPKNALGMGAGDVTPINLDLGEGGEAELSDDPDAGAKSSWGFWNEGDGNW